MTNREVTVFSNLDELSRAAAREFVRLTREKSESGFVLTVALAGGSTPKRLYELLADEGEPFRAAVEWQKINFFWGDERCVPPDNGESNFRTANEILLKPLGINPANIHRMKGECEPQSAASEYERFLRLFYNAPEGCYPRFDLILLGMGADGHTASLFPNTNALAETKRLVAANYVEKFGKFRLTFTPQVLNNADEVMFLIAGADKAEALREVLEGEPNPEKFPSQTVNPTRGKLSFFVDEAAAASLTINRKYENFTGHFRR